MEHTKWVAGWGAATSYIVEALGTHICDTTCRYRIIPTMPATKIRLHFSNRYGTEDVRIAAVTVAYALEGPSIDGGSVVEVTFGGKGAIVLGAGAADVVSDEIDLSVLPAKHLAVSLYFDELTKISTGHSNGGNFIKNYFIRGDHTHTAELDRELYVEGGAYLFLNTIDFLTSEDCSAIIAFGDSITARPWPDMLNRHLNTDENGKRAVIRRAIGGNRVLGDYAHVCRRNQGEAGVKRFERDVCGTVGASAVIVLHSINDIYHPRIDNPYNPIENLPSAEQIIGGYREYIRAAHESGLRIYFATLLNCPNLKDHHPSKEGIRASVNEWIRTNSEADGYVDFEQAVADPSAPGHMLPEYDSGDHLHPGYEGSKRLAAAAYEMLKSKEEV